MVRICRASPDISLREMAESSLKIDPNNANPLIVLMHRFEYVSTNPAMALAPRIPEIDPISPCALYLFSIASLLYFY